MPEAGPKRRVISRRHPFLRDRPRGVYYPDAVGIVKGYPKTREIWQARVDLMRQQVKLYNAEGITGRNGIPDGWGGKKKLVNEIRGKAEAEAERIVAKMIKEETFKPDCREARLAMEAAVTIVTAQKFTPDTAPVPLYNPSEVNKALKTILDFTQRKPVTKTEVAVASPEDWLKAIS